ncbi:MAG: ABC transporter ATP-binding protein [Lachnospiraceae bacterium]|nr:ABC transporter ATP-binding protein [Lachnospiraceae bacterium]
MEKTEPCIRLENVVKEFPSGTGVVKALDGITLEICPGDFVVVNGESGCGKSTLLNMIGCMDEPTEGKIEIFGQDMTKLSERERTLYRRRDVGFIFQEYHLMPELTTYENVEFIAELVNDPLSVSEVIEMVGLTDVADHRPGQLSGGQQQRNAIARAIVKRPRLLLADEPTAALDEASAREVLRVFERLIREDNAQKAPEQKTTLILVTHNREIAKMADRVVVLKNGRIASDVSQADPCSVDMLEW